NRATDDYGFVGGGNNNQAGDGTASTTNATFATVAGGKSNRAAGYGSAVLGGVANQATSGYTAVGGGLGNVASGLDAVVPGGNSTAASGSYSLAAGRQAKATRQGQYVWADSQAFNFPAASDPLIPLTNNQLLERATGGMIVVSA